MYDCLFYNVKSYYNAQPIEIRCTNTQKKDWYQLLKINMNFILYQKYSLNVHVEAEFRPFPIQIEHNDVKKRMTKYYLLVSVFNATFNNISVISWRSVLLVRETGGPGENHRPVTSHRQTLSHNVVHLALIEIRTHNIWW